MIGADLAARIFAIVFVVPVAALLAIAAVVWMLFGAPIGSAYAGGVLTGYVGYLWYLAQVDR
ncbi:hypothetical protein [Aquamicrobium sp. LC103]|uniref:hypothetical protein n=1 Tax=Aquamicrobium sp. LC103 TaxID=1120658 RepID=UPI00063EB865|nr:hypothetical protein [Aquamicrobium sp. LC103]TKT69065.1 hypothetical protein XW59_029185 [Aquamicrobium sp. LC103]